MLNSPSLNPRQALQGMSLECATLRKKLLEIALIDTPILASDHYNNAMKLLNDARSEIAHCRAIASPDALANMVYNLPDLDTIINRI